MGCNDGLSCFTNLSWSLVLTARGAWWSAHSTIQMIYDMRETPFSDDELPVHSNGRLTNDKPAYPTIRAPWGPVRPHDARS